MKTLVSESEVNRIAPDTVNLAMQKLPYNSQDVQDRELAEHFLLRKLASQIIPRMNKIEDKIKDAFKSGSIPEVTLSQNYRRELSTGNPRELFDTDAFIDAVCEMYPDVLKHKLKELAGTTKKKTAAPISISLEYIGDVVRKGVDF